jgi:curli biogenesis system outer membrane secretion channel CsgG
MNFMPGVPLGVGAQISYAELALDMRVVDVASGRVLAAQRVPGMARSARGTISALIPLGPVGIPAGLEMYRGTPMEWAVRDCIHKATLSIANAVPVEYFRHR